VIVSGVAKAGGYNARVRRPPIDMTTGLFCHFPSIASSIQRLVALSPLQSLPQTPVICSLSFIWTSHTLPAASAAPTIVIYMAQVRFATSIASLTPTLMLGAIQDRGCLCSRFSHNVSYKPLALPTAPCSRLWADLHLLSPTDKIQNLASVAPTMSTALRSARLGLGRKPLVAGIRQSHFESVPMSALRATSFAQALQSTPTVSSTLSSGQLVWQY
jgi:hypothetical protein